MPNRNTPWTFYDYTTGLSALFYGGTRATPVDVQDGFARMWYRTVYGQFFYHFSFMVGASTVVPAGALAFEFPEPLYDVLTADDPQSFTPYYLAPAFYIDATPRHYYIGQTAITIDANGLAVGNLIGDVGDGTVTNTQPITLAVHDALESGNAVPALDS